VTAYTHANNPHERVAIGFRYVLHSVNAKLALCGCKELSATFEARAPSSFAQVLINRFTAMIEYICCAAPNPNA